MVSLEGLLSKFKPNKNFDFEGRHFMTHVPWIAPKAYLNILLDAAGSDVQRETIDRLHLPTGLREFYRLYNGAHLFSDLFSLYGFFPKVYMYEREDWRKRLLYNIKNINAELNRPGNTGECFS